MNKNDSSNGSSGSSNYRFDHFSVNGRNRLLFKDGAEIPLTPKVLDILLAFLANPNQLLEKDELIDTVWNEKFVEEGNLSRNVSTLRKALGGNAQDHRYIVTIPGKGYRFVADVSSENEFGTREIEQIASPLALREKKIRRNSTRPIWLIWPLSAVVILSSAFWLASSYYRTENVGALPNVRSIKPAAQDAYIAAKFLFDETADKAGTPESRPLLLKSIELYKQAIDSDPDFAPLYVGYGRACNRLAGTGYQKEYYFDQAEFAGRKSIDLDESVSGGHGVLAFILYSRHNDLLDAEREYARALELDPNSEFRHGHALVLAMLGRLNEAVSEIEIATRTDPSQAIVRQNAGRIYLAAGQIDKAVTAFTRVVQLAPNNPTGYAHLGMAEVLAGDYNGGISNIEKYLTESGSVDDRAFLGWALARAGQTKKALKIADEFKRTTGEVPAMIYSGLGENELAVNALRRECKQSERTLRELRILPFYFNLKNDPRYQELLRTIDQPHAS